MIDVDGTEGKPMIFAQSQYRERVQQDMRINAAAVGDFEARIRREA